MADLKGTQVAAGIVPFTDLDGYATHDAMYGKGGFRSVETIADRDDISTDRKTKGMIVRVNANSLHYYWTGTSWAEWLPKGNITVDSSLNTTSTNPVQNKVINAAITAAANTANAAIPKSYIDTSIPTTPVDTRVPSTKLLKTRGDQLEALADTAIDKANIAQSTADSAKKIALAAIPKSDIEKTNSGSSTDEKVPSLDLLTEMSIILSTIAQEGIDDAADAMAAASKAQTTANNAVPKSAILTSLTGNETDNTKIASAPSIIGLYKPVAETVISHGHQIANLEGWQRGIGNKNQVNGVAGLDGSGKISASQLPAGYDNIDMLVAFVTANPTTGMTIGKKWYNTATKKIFTATSSTSGSVTTPEGDEKVYINVDTNKSYRWTGSDMVVIGDGSGVALGTTSSTAFRGDHGNTLYTNFGSGTNLTGTQKSRDFFNAASVDTYIKSIGAISVSSEQVEFGYEMKKYKDFGYQSNSGITIKSANATNAGVMTASMFKTLQEIELATFPLSLSLIGGGTYEIGNSTLSSISISVTRKGVNVTPSSTVQVTSSPNISGSLSTDKKTWTPAVNIKANTTITVKATYGSQSVSRTAAYTFKFRKYWGTSASATLTNAQILSLVGSTWADSRAMNATKFDCTGGKYPYYVIPYDLYLGLEVWVGGLKNTDIIVSDLMLNNASGSSTMYKIIRLANIQTGLLSIEFK